VQRAVDDLLGDLGDIEAHGEAFSAVFYGAIRSASEYVADADDPDLAAAHVQATIGAILAGMRLLPSIGEDASVSAAG
jgi:hypothetical protein